MMDRFSVEQSGAVFRFKPHSRGGNVLYLDGHVEFVTYPTEPPFVRPFGEMLPVIDALSGRKTGS
jgi:prepilin-type processing-associated H-X9-DG protein